MIATFQDLQTLTGRTRSDAVKRELVRMGVHFFTRQDGRPVTTLAAIDRALVGTAPGAAAPRLSALR